MKPFNRFCLMAFLITVVMACGKIKSGNQESSAGDDCVTVAPDYEHLPSTVPFFDAHGHRMPKWDLDILSTAVAEGGLVGMALLGPADTLVAQQTDPNTFLGCIYVDVVDGEITEADLKPLIDGLDAGVRCIGEVKVRHFASGTTPHDIVFPADNPFMMALYEEARKRDIPVTVHFDYGEDQMEDFESALEQTRDVEKGNTNIIWAHMGDAPSHVVDDMLTKHENLFVDISSRNPLCSFADRILPMGEQRLDDGSYTLKPEWKDLFEEHKDRVLFGTDIGPGDRHTFLIELMEHYRVILGQLSPEAQTKIGAANAQLLFGVTGVSDD